MGRQQADSPRPVCCLSLLLLQVGFLHALGHMAANSYRHILPAWWAWKKSFFPPVLIWKIPEKGSEWFVMSPMTSWIDLHRDDKRASVYGPGPACRLLFVTFSSIALTELCLEAPANWEKFWDCRWPLQVRVPNLKLCVRNAFEVSAEESSCPLLEISSAFSSSTVTMRTIASLSLPCMLEPHSSTHLIPPPESRILSSSSPSWSHQLRQAVQASVPFPRTYCLTLGRGGKYFNYLGIYSA